MLALLYLPLTEFGQAAVGIAPAAAVVALVASAVERVAALLAAVA